MSNAERVVAALATVFTADEIEMDGDTIDRMIAALEPITSPDVVTVMTGSDAAFTGTFEGSDGLRAAWADWLDTFTSVRFEIENVEEIGGNVLTIGRQLGTTRHGGVAIEQASAAVWKFRDGLIVRVEFHLDRDKARASAAEPA
jgi:ketosteroid isomerase-like protein